MSSKAAGLRTPVQRSFVIGHCQRFALQGAGIDWRVNVYGGAKHAFWARPTNPDGSPSGETSHAEATVPGVGYHPAHTPRAWRSVLDLTAETIDPR